MTSDGPPQTGRRGADALLVVALAQGMTVDQAATVANVSHKTVDRRLADPEFRARLDKFRVELVRAVADRLACASARAIDRLDALLDSDDPKVVLASARELLAHLAVVEAAGAKADERVRLGEDAEYTYS